MVSEILLLIMEWIGTISFATSGMLSYLFFGVVFIIC